MDTNLFNDFAANYDRMINWPNRLKRETPFFQAVFSENNVKSILDTACGTGWHAINLARLGYRVMGTDISTAMVEAARDNARKEAVAIEFKEAGLADLINKVLKSYDAITCLGNSLPHLLKDEALLAALAGFYRLLSPEGVLVIQVRNYVKAIKEKARFMPLNTWQKDNEEYIFIRMQDFLPEEVEFHIITLHRTEGGKWDFRDVTNKLRPINRETLSQFLIQAGFSRFDYFGDYDFHPFDEEIHSDLIIVAKK